MPKVSVIIPVYNQAPYLAECLDSVLAQSLREIEVICIDDGSTDGSELMLDGYAKRDPRVKVIHQANAGVATARNNGLAAATGEFVAFMDPDDKYPDEKALSELVQGAELNGLDVCGGSLRTFGGASLGSEFTFEEDAILEFFDYQFEYGFYRYVYKRTLLAAAGVRFPDLVRFQDVPFCVEALHAAGRFYALKRVAYLYRDGHHAVKWSANGGVKAEAHVRGILMTLELARKYGYDRMATRLRERLVSFVRLLCSESNGLQTDLDERRAELAEIRASRAFRIGEALAYPVRRGRDLLKGTLCL